MNDAASVVLDANIVIAASVYYDPGGADPVKHRIHDEAAALLERLAESGKGCIVPAVRSEAINALARAVKGAAYVERAGAPLAEVGRRYHAALTRSRVRLGGIMRSVNSARPDPGRVAYNLGLVERMSESLWERYSALAGSGPAPRGASGGARLPPEALQLGRFAKKHPNRGDQRVLAEAAAFRDSLPAGSRVVIASSDTGFFSPYRHPGGVSDAVTAEIYGRFGIRCDHPEAILREECGAE